MSSRLDDIIGCALDIMAIMTNNMTLLYINQIRNECYLTRERRCTSVGTTLMTSSVWNAICQVCCLRKYIRNPIS